ncbi:SHOCT domain-containing protein [uncultured Amphritea sp.]|uniref:SHOCT domain-containing protein n=1 Tax=uncultured Amphritea sp. TaxID=981605 RepID=UPI002605F4B5|nr:SHOCT domain-containing protein [uncultured Amphritea sp.]
MQSLTDVGETFVNNIASRYGLSYGAVVHMLVAVNNGRGSMAQFNCPELGGSGQWMRGGMTMVGDMFNHGLKATVNNLCFELSDFLANNQVFPVVPAGTPGSNQWWPVELGQPFSSGAQNNTRYAVFPNRLAVEVNGQVSVYDTLNNNIGGVSQQQGGNNSLTFSSQFGTIAVNSLPLVKGPGLAPAPQNNFAALVSDNTQNSSSAPAPAPAPQHAPPVNVQPSTPAVHNTAGHSDINSTLELLGKLAQLRDAGALTDDEFNAKKTELLSRI